MAMSTAAMPTSECIAATSSGICVISHPARHDDADNGRHRQRAERQVKRRVTANVVRTASAMPIMPKTLPRLRRERM